jgi:hypothetical protein
MSITGALSAMAAAMYSLPLSKRQEQAFHGTRRFYKCFVCGRRHNMLTSLGRRFTHCRGQHQINRKAVTR